MHYRVTADKHTFITYPFPKHLLIDIKLGYYKVIGADGKEEVVEADNAKDALGKTTLKEINKIEYLGFCSKSIVEAKELIEDENYVEPTAEAAKAPVAEEPKVEAATEEPKPEEVPTEEPKTQDGNKEQ